MSISATELDGSLNATAFSTDPVTLDASTATEGSLLLACLSAIGTASTVTAPAGWTLVEEALTSGSLSSKAAGWVFRKIAGASESAHDFTPSSGTNLIGTLIQVTGSDGTVSASTHADVDASTTQALSSLSVSANGAAFVVMATNGISNTNQLPATIPTPTGFTEISERLAGNFRRVGVAPSFRTYSSAGSTGVVNTPTADTHVAIMLVVGPGTPSVSPTGQKNGFDIIASSTNTTVGNWTVKAGTASSETARTIQSVTQINGTQVRIRLANGERFLSGDSVLVSSTADSVTDESATNNSLQTSTTVAIETVNGGHVTCTFASAPTVGILAGDDLSVTSSVTLNSIAYTQGTNEEKYQIRAYLNANADKDAQQPFYEGADAYNATLAASFPLSLSEDDCLTLAVSGSDKSTHATNTVFEVGDVIKEATKWFRCTVGGTTAGTKPTFLPSSETVTDGSVTWTRFGPNGTVGQGRSPIRKMVVLHCAGSSLKSQETYRCHPYAGGTKTYYTRSDLNLGKLPGHDNGFSSVSTAENIAKHYWYDPGRVAIFQNSTMIPGENYRAYGEDMLADSVTAIATAMGDASHKSRLIDYCVQRGIDQIGARETGAFWQADGGWTQGRLQFAMFAAGVLELGESTATKLRQNQHTTFDWHGTDIGDQYFYIGQEDIDRTLDSKYQYGDNGIGGKVFLSPDTDPSTLSPTADSPTSPVPYFPATVRNDWLHTPEWCIRYAQEKESATPVWGFNDTENYYRRTANGGSGGTAYIAGLMGVRDIFDSERFWDFVDRYEYIEAPANDWDYDRLWTLYMEDRPAFAFTASAVIVGGTWYIDLNFNRYATQTNANILAQFACSGGITLSNADQTGPRTFRVQADADPRGQTITYTQSGTAANRVVDAGNNELPTASTARVPVAGTGQVQAEGTIRMNFQLPSGLWGSTITPDNTKITAISQVTGGTRTFTVGSVSGAGTGTLQVILTPTPLIYSVAAGGTVTVTIAEGWLTDENGNTTAAYSGIADGDNSSTQTPATGGNSTKGNFGIHTGIKIGV